MFFFLKSDFAYKTVSTFNIMGLFLFSRVALSSHFLCKISTIQLWEVESQTACGLSIVERSKTHHRISICEILKTKKCEESNRHFAFLRLNSPTTTIVQFYYVVHLPN